MGKRECVFIVSSHIGGYPYGRLALISYIAIVESDAQAKGSRPYYETIFA